MKRIKCSNTDCGRVFAHLLDEGTVDVARLNHHFTVVGGTYTFMGTCPQCTTKTALRVVDGKLDENGILFKEEKPDGEEENNNNGQERQEEGNQPSPVVAGDPAPVGSVVGHEDPNPGGAGSPTGIADIPKPARTVGAKPEPANPETT